ncbi:MotA/TolQ/ExbB proton channel family protein [Pseudohongiella sp. SYSU M77423]|uniref:MotA/TolQ/ExbB proton channel family protein n=1 Tax=unclassified Pseudohongiella TaxID=2629611 RepID=UPI000C5198CE|nr:MULTISPECIES: MotA/TolQ/ExbB proton channel family protein [unclassified Pseudohongiella]MAY56487.1 biopolymer transporter ExbB [Gammaproteobacteria bacterium]MBJ54604.1 biopolymer transporter ExbB [Gammaproteobacteria bacterium]MDH7943157.1 MotA/TolQ/ExbB proton channel family protein [Pseudohongiella sp. SYSU M77423]MEC8860115.1 MotA/TolQ/ExbB proton channel family protein [Pseudomonadota bacterium]|tara:strand:+ start:148 stop:669 length:522 start_codon:yes stop_codon:yes gene_type:complete
MYFALLDLSDAISDFMARGGGVLWIIGVLLLVMWSLIFERLWYLHSTHAKRVKHTLAAWAGRSDTKSWKAQQIRNMMVSQISLDLRSTMPIIETLVVVCPLLGLLGTVTGMIEVFYVMALTGGGDAKSMAGGVSKATIPTMAGMVGALSGIFASNWLKSRIDRDLELLEDHMA